MKRGRANTLSGMSMRWTECPASARCVASLDRAAGVAIVLISEELDEILTLSDRIVVMFEGRIAGSFAADEADIEQIGLLMTGGAADRDPVAAETGAG